LIRAKPSKWSAMKASCGSGIWPQKLNSCGKFMRHLLEFLKTTVIGGFLVLLPVVAVLVLIGIALHSVIGIIAPMAANLPIKTIGGYAAATLLAVLLILGFCFLAGLLVQLRLGQLVQSWLESHLLRRLPGYTMVKNLTRQVAGQEGTEFAPALIDLYGSEARVIGLIMEELDDGRMTVFVPLSPTSTLGQVYILPAAKVTKLKARFLDVANTLTQWGAEAEKVLAAPPAVDEKPKI
jgi:uncharacterized membrane protein